MIEIIKATIDNSHTAAELAVLLWPGHEKAEMVPEFIRIISDSDSAVFLAFQDNQPVGFAQCQLRHDYVEGTSSSPVGYLEGIYVVDCFRKSGIARQLLVACENWARSKGCTEFASDCELSNTDSLHFHMNVGFEEANRIICFAKKL